MKAIRVHEFGAPEVLRLEEVPDPQPGPGQVVVQVHAAGVNPLDTLLRAGIPIGDYALDLPYTPGNDAAGVIAAVGEGVNRVAVGDRVYAQPLSGAYAELTLCNESQVYPLPQHISYSQGSAVNIPYRTAYYALFYLAKAVPGEVVLVQGASGTVGTAAVQLARAAGLKVIGTAGSEKGQRFVTEQGAQHTLDYHVPDYLNQAVDLTNGHGVDVILEMVADVNLAKDLDILALGGRVVVIGTHGKAEIDPVSLIGRGTSIVGLNLLAIPAQTTSSIHAALVAGLENGTLRPVIGQEMALADAPLAHRAIETSGSPGRIALIP